MNPKQNTTGRYQIVIGPWKHGQGLDDSIQLEWYDTWLKGKDTGIADTARRCTSTSSSPTGG